MLTELRLQNFKCFGAEVVIPTARLNLLTGINAKGKSTTLQSILALHQSLDRALTGTRVLSRVDLNGRYTHLGNLGDVRNRDRPKGDTVQIAVETTDPDSTVTMTRLFLHHGDDSSRWMSIRKIEVESLRGSEAVFEDAREAPDDGPVMLDFNEASSLREDRLALASRLDRLARVHYVSADRLGPQEFYVWSDDPGFSSVGVRGERTAEVLHLAEGALRRIEDERAREEGETQLVSDQASAWLSYIFDGGKLRVRAPHATILTLEMNSDGSSHYHRPINVGFGYSYALPLIVAGLVARPQEILICENPEAHLHPLAQSRLGEFLATVSRTGVQVFVESHSEHILNAFRLAVKSKAIQQDDLSVLYFRRHDVDPVVRVRVEANGQVRNWPEGFFDQRTKDLFNLFGE